MPTDELAAQDLTKTCIQVAQVLVFFGAQPIRRIGHQPTDIRGRFQIRYGLVLKLDGFHLSGAGCICFGHFDGTSITVEAADVDFYRLDVFPRVLEQFLPGL